MRSRIALCLVTFVSISLNVLIAQTVDSVRDIDGATPAGLGGTWNVEGDARASCVVGDVLYLGGCFTKVNGIACKNLATINLKTKVVSSWCSHVDGEVYALASDGEKIFVGGKFACSFNTGGGDAATVVKRNNLIALNKDGTADLRCPGVGGEVKALTCAGGILYVGGSFRRVGNQPRQNIASMKCSGDASEVMKVTEWAPAVDGAVHAIAVDDESGDIFIGGAFDAVNGQACGKMAGFTASGACKTWDPQFDGNVHAICFGGDGEKRALYTGGEFTHARGKERNRLAAFVPGEERSGWALSEWNVGADGPVYALDTYEDGVAIGGDFDELGGEPVENAGMAQGASYGSSAATSSPFAPTTLPPPVVPPTVSSLVIIPGGTIIIAGGPTVIAVRVIVYPFGKILRVRLNSPTGPILVFNATQDFGTLNIGQTSAPRRYYLVNESISNQNINVSNLIKNGTNPGDFILNTGTFGTGGVIPWQQNRWFEISFAPTVSGFREANVQFTHDAFTPSSPFKIHPVGTGAGTSGNIVVHETSPTGTIVVNDSPPANGRIIDNIPVGTSSAPLRLYIVNSGATTLGAWGLQLSGSTQFSLNSGTFGGDIPPGQNKWVEVTFSPINTITQTATVQFFHSAGNTSSPFKINLSGTGIIPNPGLVVTSDETNPPTVIPYNAPATGGRDFGQWAINMGSTPSVTFTITNDGTGTTTVGVPAINGGSAEFLISAQSFPATLAPGQSASFTIRFHPCDPTPVLTKSVEFTHNATNIAPSPFKFAVSGQGVSPTGGAGGLPSSFFSTFSTTSAGGELGTHVIKRVGDIIYVGGNFGGTNNLFALDVCAGGLPGWTSPSIDGPVYDLVVFNGRVYFCGSFLWINGELSPNLACVDANTGAFVPWIDTGTLLILGGGAGGTTISSLTASGSYIYAGGQFRWTIPNSGIFWDGLLKVDANTGIPDLNFPSMPSPSLGNWVNAMTLSPSATELFITGRFNIVGTTPRQNLAKITLSTNAVSTTFPEIMTGGEGFAVSYLNGKIYVGGTFTDVTGPVDPSGLIKIDPATDTVENWNANLGGMQTVKAIRRQSGMIFIGGDFDSVGGLSRLNLAAVDEIDASPEYWNPEATGGAVNALEFGNAALFGGGHFTDINQNGPGGLARFPFLYPIDQHVYEDTATDPEIVNGAMPANGRVFGTWSLDDGPTPALAIVVKNEGLGKLGLSMPIIESGDAADFVLDTTSFPQFLNPKSSASFTLAFDPQSAGSKLITVRFDFGDYNNLSPFTFQASGTGALPTIQVTDASMNVVVNGSAPVGDRDFGDVNVGSPFSQTMITIKNTGTVPLQLGDPQLDGGDTDDFGINLFGFQTPLDPSDIAVFFMNFDPQTVGAKLVQVTFTHNASNTTTPFRVLFGGNGIGPAVPTLNTIGNKTTSENTLLQFTASANDPDSGEILRYTADDGAGGPLPAGASINAYTGKFTWTPDFSQAQGSPYTVRVTVTDFGGLSDSESFTISVNNVNQAPVISSSGNRTVIVNQLLQFDVTASDADPGNALTFFFSNLPSGASFTQTGPTSAQFSWTPIAGQVGVYSYVGLSVTDDDLSSPLDDTDIIAITVTTTPSTVIAASGSGQTAAVGEDFTSPLRAQVVNVNCDPVAGETVTFTVTGGAANFAGASFTAAITDLGGYATAPSLTAGPAAGAVTVTASVFGGSSDDFNLVSGSATGVAARATITSGPVTVGSPVSIALQAVDEGGNDVTDFIATVDVVISGAGNFTDEVTFIAADNGFKALTGYVTFLVSGNQEIVVTPQFIGGIVTQTVVPVSVSGASTIRIIEGGGEDVARNSVAATLPRYQVIDAYGNAVAGASVTAQVIAGDAQFAERDTGGLNFLGTSYTTAADNDGIPEAFYIYAEDGYEPIVVELSCPGTSPVEMEFTPVDAFPSPYGLRDGATSTISSTSFAWYNGAAYDSIEVLDPDSGNVIDTLGGSAESYVAGGLEPNEPVAIFVRGVVGGVPSIASGVNTAFALCPTPSAANVEIVRVYADKVEIRISNFPNAFTGFGTVGVERAYESDFSDAFDFGYFNSTHIVDDLVDPAKEAYYRVRFKNGDDIVTATYTAGSVSPDPQPAGIVTPTGEDMLLSPGQQLGPIDVQVVDEIGEPFPTVTPLTVTFAVVEGYGSVITASGGPTVVTQTDMSGLARLPFITGIADGEFVIDAYTILFGKIVNLRFHGHVVSGPVSVEVISPGPFAMDVGQTLSGIELQTYDSQNTPLGPALIDLRLTLPGSAFDTNHPDVIDDTTAQVTADSSGYAQVPDIIGQTPSAGMLVATLMHPTEPGLPLDTLPINYSVLSTNMASPAVTKLDGDGRKVPFQEIEDESGECEGEHAGATRPIEVQVTNSLGQPIAGATVHFYGCDADEAQPERNPIVRQLPFDAGEEPDERGNDQSYLLGGFKVNGAAYPVAYAKAVALPDGKVAVIGGTGNASNPTADLKGTVIIDAMDCFLSAYELHDCASLALVPRYGHQALLLDDERILIIGGIDSAGGPAPTLIWDFVDNIITPVPSLNADWSFGSALVYDSGDKALLVGGRTAAGANLPFAVSIDISSGTFGNVVSLTSPNIRRESSIVYDEFNDMAYVIGSTVGSTDLHNVARINLAGGTTISITNLPGWIPQNTSGDFVPRGAISQPTDVASGVIHTLVVGDFGAVAFDLRTGNYINEPQDTSGIVPGNDPYGPDYDTMIHDPAGLSFTASAPVFARIDDDQQFPEGERTERLVAVNNAGQAIVYDPLTDGRAVNVQFKVVNMQGDAKSAGMAMAPFPANAIGGEFIVVGGVTGGTASDDMSAFATTHVRFMPHEHNKPRFAKAVTGGDGKASTPPLLLHDSFGEYTVLARVFMPGQTESSLYTVFVLDAVGCGVIHTPFTPAGGTKSNATADPADPEPSCPHDEGGGGGGGGGSTITTKKFKSFKRQPLIAIPDCLKCGKTCLPAIYSDPVTIDAASLEVPYADPVTGEPQVLSFADWLEQAEQDGELSPIVQLVYDGVREENPGATKEQIARLVYQILVQGGTVTIEGEPIEVDPVLPGYKGRVCVEAVDNPAAPGTSDLTLGVMVMQNGSMVASAMAGYNGGGWTEEAVAEWDIPSSSYGVEDQICLSFEQTTPCYMNNGEEPTGFGIEGFFPATFETPEISTAGGECEPIGTVKLMATCDPCVFVDCYGKLTVHNHGTCDVHVIIRPVDLDGAQGQVAFVAGETEPAPGQKVALLAPMAPIVMLVKACDKVERWFAGVEHSSLKKDVQFQVIYHTDVCTTAETTVLDFVTQLREPDEEDNVVAQWHLSGQKLHDCPSFAPFMLGLLGPPGCQAEVRVVAQNQDRGGKICMSAFQLTQPTDGKPKCEGCESTAGDSSQFDQVVCLTTQQPKYSAVWGMCASTGIKDVKIVVDALSCGVECENTPEPPAGSSGSKYKVITQGGPQGASEENKTTVGTTSSATKNSGGSPTPTGKTGYRDNTKKAEEFEFHCPKEEVMTVVGLEMSLCLTHTGGIVCNDAAPHGKGVCEEQSDDATCLTGSIELTGHVAGPNGFAIPLTLDVIGGTVTGAPASVAGILVREPAPEGNTTSDRKKNACSSPTAAVSLGSVSSTTLSAMSDDKSILASTIFGTEEFMLDCEDFTVQDWDLDTWCGAADPESEDDFFCANDGTFKFQLTATPALKNSLGQNIDQPVKFAIVYPDGSIAYPGSFAINPADPRTLANKLYNATLESPVPASIVVDDYTIFASSMCDSPLLDPCAEDDFTMVSLEVAAEASCTPDFVLETRVKPAGIPANTVTLSGGGGFAPSNINITAGGGVEYYAVTHSGGLGVVPLTATLDLGNGCTCEAMTTAKLIDFTLESLPACDEENIFLDVYVTPATGHDAFFTSTTSGPPGMGTLNVGTVSIAGDGLYEMSTTGYGTTTVSASMFIPWDDIDGNPFATECPASTELKRGRIVDDDPIDHPVPTAPFATSMGVTYTFHILPEIDEFGPIQAQFGSHTPAEWGFSLDAQGHPQIKPAFRSSSLIPVTFYIDLGEGVICQRDFLVQPVLNQSCDGNICTKPDAVAPIINSPPTSGTPYGDEDDIGDPVQLDRGDLLIARSDLVIPGRGFDFAHVRSYRGMGGRDTTQGLKWDHAYNLRLDLSTAGEVGIVEGDKIRTEIYADNGDGTFGTPDQHFIALTFDGSEFRLLQRDGMVQRFDLGGKLIAQSDSNGNLMEFLYEDSLHPTRLSAVVDTMGRRIEYAYYPDNDVVVGRRGKLESVMDFDNRAVVYDYDDDGSLISARTPVVTGTSTGNNFPNGKLETYQYVTDTVNPARDNLLFRVVRPNENESGPWGSSSGVPLGSASFEFTYDDDGRVLTQQWGTAAQQIGYEYESTFLPENTVRNAAFRLTRVTDRNGNVAEYYFSDMGQIVEKRELTSQGTITTNWKYNSFNQLLLHTLPEGNSTEYVYDDGVVMVGGSPVTDPRLRANVIETIERRGPRPADQDEIRTRIVTEPIYNKPCVIVEPRGYESGDNLKYATRSYFDWEEGDNRQALAGYLVPHLDSTPVTGDGWQYVDALLMRTKAQAMALGLGATDNVPAANIAVGTDLNDDGETARIAGNVVRTLLPKVTLDPDAQAAMGLASPDQYITTALYHNRFGQVTGAIDAEGNIAATVYFPTANPSGIGGPEVWRDDNSISGGYASTVYRDQSAASNNIVVARYVTGVLTDQALGSFTSPITRTTSVAPHNVTSSFTYNLVGVVTSFTDPRGSITAFEINSLDQIVSITAPGPYSYSTSIFYDANDNVVRTEVENAVVALDGNGRLQLTDSGQFTNLTLTGGTPAVFVHTSEYNILDDLTKQTIDATKPDGTVVLLTTLFGYDFNQNLTTITQPMSNVVKNVFDQRDLLESVTRGFGSSESASVSFEYDGNGNRIKFYDGTGDLTETTFDGFDRVRMVEDAEGNLAHFTYDAAGNGISSRLEGPIDGSQGTAADGAPIVDLMRSYTAYDEIGRAFEEKSDLFDETGAALNTGGPLFNLPYTRHLTAFDKNSRVVAAIEDDGHFGLSEFDGLNRLVAATDALGNSMAYSYDAASNVVQTVETALATDGVTQSETYTTTYRYDVLNRLTRVTDNLFNETQFGYDSRNNRTHSTDALLNTSSTLLDGANRVLETRRDMRGTAPNVPDDVINTFYTWDGNSRLEQIKDDRNNITDYDYDALNRQWRTTYANLAAITLGFDDDDNVLTSLDQNGTLVTNVYDRLNRVTSRTATLPGGGSGVFATENGTSTIVGSTLQTFEYDGASRLTKSTDNNDAGTSDDAECVYVYDSLSRVTSDTQTYAAMPMTVSYGWVSDHLQRQVNYPGGNAITRTFDDLDRVSTMDWTEGVYTGAEDMRYDYIGPERVLKRTVFDAVTRDFHVPGDPTKSSYDGLKRPVYLSYKSGSESVADTLTFGYDAVGNQTFEYSSGLDVQFDAPSVGLELYSHDAAYRLDHYSSGAHGSGVPTVPMASTQSGDTRLNGQGASAPPLLAATAGFDMQWSLDGVGNWRGYTLDAPIVAPVQRDSIPGVINQTTGFDTTGDGLPEINLDHAPNGNTVVDRTLRYGSYSMVEYEFDAFNRLRRVFDPTSGQTWGRYDYDAQGRRVYREADVDHNGSTEETVRYLYDGDQVVEECYGAAATIVLRIYVYGNYIDEPLWMKEYSLVNAGEYVFCQDENFNVYELYQWFPGPSWTSPVYHYRYDAYGSFVCYEVIGPTSVCGPRNSTLGSSLLYYFQGRRFDMESGLYEYRARYYNPDTGRFTSFDPLGYVDGMNLYEFVQSSPLNMLDPFGLSCHQSWWEEAIETVGNVGAGIVGGFVEGVTFGAVDATAVGDFLGADTNSAAFQVGAVVGQVVAEVGIAAATGGAGVVAKAARVAIHVMDAVQVGRSVAEGDYLGAALGAISSAPIGKLGRKTGNIELPAPRPHGNSSKYAGETHVYRVKNPDGTTYKIGESMQGVRKRDGASIRGEQQARRLNREVGPGHESEIRKSFPDKQSARDHERRAIEKFKGLYGDDSLPGNKTNR